MGDEEVKRWHDISEMVNRVEDALPADCPICGWGLPGPHHENCRLFSALRELESACHGLRAEADGLLAQVERLTRERDYWRQQMELAGPELDRLRGKCPSRGRRRMLPVGSVADRIEDALPADCPICGWGLPGPHHADCRLFAALCEVDALAREADELRELAWRWCIEARAQLRRREAE